jgi:hypothetical protein
LSEETGTESNILSRLSAFQASEEAPQNEPVEAVAAPQATEAEVEQPAATGTDTEQPEQPDQPEETVEAGTLVDLDFDGKQFKVAPEIREAVMRHADYTKKTMGLADDRNLFQKTQAIAEEHAAFSKSIESESTELAQIDAQLVQFKALPWDEFDTQQTLRAKMAQDNLKERKVELKQAVDAKRDEFSQQAQKSRKELYEKTNEYLTKAIPQWGSQAANEFVAAAQAVGFTREEVGNFIDHRAIQLAWKAAQWDKLQAAKPIVSKKASEVPPVTKPGSQATTESTASKQYQKLRDELKRTGSEKAARELMKFR